MKRELQFSWDARNSLKKGIDLAVRTVGISYGPTGRNVLIHNRNEKPQVTKSGAQVLKNLSRKDHYEDIGIKPPKVSQKIPWQHAFLGAVCQTSRV